MNIISHQKSMKSETGKSLLGFFRQFHVNNHLRNSNVRKYQGFPVWEIFYYLICRMFSDRTMYMEYQTGKEMPFSKNTVYRFLNSLKSNWQLFTAKLSCEVVNNFFRPLTSADRDDAFVIDDTIFERLNGYKTELNGRVYDHANSVYKNGYRLLTLGWTDGISFAPITSALLASSKDSNIHMPAKEFEHRCHAKDIRDQSRRKATDVMFELLTIAMKQGHRAKYVLFDTWFSSPSCFIRLKKMNLNAVAMIKNSSKVYYKYQGERLSVKEICKKMRKRRGRAKWLFSADVVLTDKEGSRVRARIVCVRSNKNKKVYKYLLTTDMDLNPEDVIRIYGKRWEIEVFFKACKSLLRLSKECQSTSFDAINAHVAFVFTRYLFLSVCQRRQIDQKSICQLMYVMIDEMDDLTFAQALERLFQIMADVSGKTDQEYADMITTLLVNFFKALPKEIRSKINTKKLEASLRAA